MISARDVFTLTLAVAWLVGCAASSNSEVAIYPRPERNETRAAARWATAPEAAYFPPPRGPWEQTVYGSIESALSRMGEPPLNTSGERAVRFVWLRTFDNPVVVRVSDDGGWAVAAKRADGASAYETGKVIEHVQRRLTADESAALNTWLSRLQSFANSDIEPVGLDGALWVFETATGGDHMAFYRHSPRRDDDAREFGLFLLGLSGFELEPVY